MDLEGLSDEVQGDPRHGRSVVDDRLGELDETNREILLDVLRNPQASPHRVSQSLSDKGMTLSVSAINRWRKMNGVK